MHIIPYFNGLFTLTENILNVCSYVPDKNIRIHVSGIRCGFGIVQIVVGIAFTTFGMLAQVFSRSNQIAHYLTFPQQAKVLGLFFVNHGLLNIGRSGLEYYGLNFLTFGYDFYGRKLLPSLSPQWDLTERLFHFVRAQLDRIQLMTLIPPRFHFKAS